LRPDHAPFGTLWLGNGVGKVAAPQCSRAQTEVQRPALQHCTAPVDIAYAADTPARWSAG